MQELKSEFLFTFHATLDPPQIVGPTPKGMRVIVYVTGGTITGPYGSGTVLPGGGDWLVQRSDGVGLLDVRASAQMDDDSIVYVTYPGYMKVDPEIMGRVMGGEEVDPSEYYFRTTPVFETASEKYGELNSTVAVGIGRLGAGTVGYDIYAIR